MLCTTSFFALFQHPAAHWGHHAASWGLATLQLSHLLLPLGLPWNPAGFCLGFSKHPLAWLSFFSTFPFLTPLKRAYTPHEFGMCVKRKCEFGSFAGEFRYRRGQHSPGFALLLLELWHAPGFPCAQLAPALKRGEKYKNWAKQGRHEAHMVWEQWGKRSGIGTKRAVRKGVLGITGQGLGG